jgi:hypothetical protein
MYRGRKSYGFPSSNTLRISFSFFFFWFLFSSANSEGKGERERKKDEGRDLYTRERSGVGSDLNRCVSGIVAFKKAHA